jgi:hypothetical protein
VLVDDEVIEAALFHGNGRAQESHNWSFFLCFYFISFFCNSLLNIEAHHEVKARFNERFLLSLVSCKQALVMDDQLDILPISLSSRVVEPLPAKKVYSSVIIRIFLLEVR